MSQVLDDNANYIVASQSTVYGLDGDDKIITTQGGPNLYGGLGNDFLGNQGTGSLDADGGQGNDTIHGGTVGDRLFGGSGDDFLVGGEFSYFSALSGTVEAFNGEVSGDDYLDGGTGGDGLYGFDGADTLLGGDGSDTNVLLTFIKDDTSTASYYTNIVGGLYGGAGDDYLDGGRGKDYLDGGDDDDLLYGGLGNDVLLGGKGVDKLHGQEGNDTLNGGFGKDRMNGGDGNDIFVFNTKPNSSSNFDVIRDFSNSSGNNDIIHLENSVFTKVGSAGKLSSGAFYAGTSGHAHDTSDRIIYETDTGKLFYDSNGSKSGGSVLVAVLTDHPHLTASDFFII